MLRFNGKILRRLRTERGVTLDGFAGLVGRSRATVNFWERGHRQPSYSDLGLIARSLGVPPQDLLDYTDEQ